MAGVFIATRSVASEHRVAVGGGASRISDRLSRFSALAIFLGTNDLAAQQIAFNISNFSILPAFAFGVAATTLVGQNLGAKNPERAEQSALQAWKSGMVWMVLMGVGFFVWRGFLVWVDTDVWDVQRSARCA